MPTFLARGVSARLGTMPLAGTISERIVLRKGEEAKKQSDAAEKQLQNSRLLKEVSVPFPGDEERYRLNWLGNAPFMQVQAGWDAFDEECAETTRATAGVPSSQEPKALVLHVNLSDRTYVTGLHDHKTSLKIEVFFNGQLNSCWLMATHDVRTGVKGHHQMFAGARVDFLAERPWVILPPETEPAVSLTTHHEPTSVLQRWQDICRALKKEANERGVNEQGEVPPTATFLQALAAMQMPDEVRHMQKIGGKVFGTIDVIVTSGEGKKLTSGVGYLKAPKRMFDENFPLMKQSDGEAADVQTVETRQTGSDNDLKTIQHDYDGFDANTESEYNQGYSLSTQEQSLDADRPDIPSASDFVPYSGISDNLQHIQGQGISSDLNNQPCQPNTAPYFGPLQYPPFSFPEPNQPLLMGPMQDFSIVSNRFGPNASVPPYLLLGQPFQCVNDGTSPLLHGNLTEAGHEYPRTRRNVTPVQFSSHQVPGLREQGVVELPHVPLPRPNNYLEWPAPPIGLYSVPTKPKRSIFPRKDTLSVRVKKDGRDILLTRLVIRGQNKTVLIDHKWDPPKRITVRSGRLVCPESQLDHSASMNECLESSKSGDMSDSICQPEKTAVYMETSAPTSSENFSTDVSLKATPHMYHSLDESTDLCRKTHTLQSNDARLFAQSEKDSVFSAKYSCDRRASPSSSMFAVQSPETNPRLFGKPEEMLRETYPLSSLYIAPNIGLESMEHTLQSEQSSPITPVPIGTADSSNEHIVLPSLDRSHGALFPTVPNSAVEATPSSMARKRRASTGAVTKRARNRTCLKTDDNSSLNQNCIITYAKNKGEENEQGVFRQVRSERCGVFQEDYVVFAARFFVGEKASMDKE
ncbi:hypothetical protein COCHEDRAFT_1114239 [Bipolaris maydis C5]|uniref:Uncharacterized protein n=1 Tax=Cochliobolus heterostrophus (strain C5 / ATCC 48332 / race O) TaxID=701091 RepID=M2TYM1_COCH5|nr:hypothetical protein COCHEDRAFT_1114239 [Bipolaris maydis C5]KAJ5020798.1 hypothetical protein J3E73DRAFT_395189 [Bipolaris maydis]KAJ5021096.1 hypothetical protein J3E73DRAFT_375541 [Bipolaris maydis]KAJ5021725.1 hypothetical protein J3E73DRAFT_199202 [Bipolaris maydis]KAJ6193011.1 hypothetical protein J3E72DRAFT_203251 [Bipolaris maydis]